MKTEMLKGKVFRLQNDFLIYFATRGLSYRNKCSMSFIGNDYSGYWYPDDLVDSAGTIWGVGLGMDSSFELELGQKGYRVLGFEPDPECFAAAKTEFSVIDSKIFNYGIWDKNGTFESFGTSISLVNIFENPLSNDDALEIRDIQEVARSLNFDNQLRPRVLKMNIEGAEFEILQSLVKEPLNFEIIMFQAEFLLHLSFFKFAKKIRSAFELRETIIEFHKRGYRLVHNYRNQFTLRLYNLEG